VTEVMLRIRLAVTDCVDETNDSVQRRSSTEMRASPADVPGNLPRRSGAIISQRSGVIGRQSCHFHIRIQDAARRLDCVGHRRQRNFVPSSVRKSGTTNSASVDAAACDFL